MHCDEEIPIPNIPLVPQNKSIRFPNDRDYDHVNRCQDDYIHSCEHINNIPGRLWSEGGCVLRWNNLEKES